MGNAITRLQDVVDSVSTIGDLNPVLVSTGGFAQEPALTIANDVIQDMLSQRFPWKWNRAKYPPFYLVSRQQDYASLDITDVGWLENAYRIQINTTIVPPPAWPIECVRDLNISRVMAGWPTRVATYPNNQLEQGTWPGPYETYLNPSGEPITPDNPYTNILDAYGNILVLTKWGTTGSVEPVAPEWTDPLNPQPDNWPIGAVIQDGTCQWTVADPFADGIRMFPPPPDAAGATWLIRIFYQKNAPVYTSLQQTIDPVPEDNSKTFRDGFIAFAHRYSATPAVRARYGPMKQEWLASIKNAMQQGDREDEGRGFFPDRGMLHPEYYTDPGPGNPYWRQWGGS